MPKASYIAQQRAWHGARAKVAITGSAGAAPSGAMSCLAIGLPVASSSSISSPASASEDWLNLEQQQQQQLCAAGVPPHQYTGLLLQPEGDAILGPLKGDCFNIVLTRSHGLAYPVAHIWTVPNSKVHDADVFDLVAFLQTCLRAKKPFCFYHDLRHLSAVSSRKQVGALFGFVSRHKRDMDAHLKCTAIVIGGSLIKVLVNWLIGLFRPAQPTMLFSTPEEAEAFLRKHVSTPA